jgi:hypothetical protein
MRESTIPNVVSTETGMNPAARNRESGGREREGGDELQRGERAATRDETDEEQRGSR